MPRYIKEITHGWEFAIGPEPSSESYTSVYLPHDWAITSPLNKNVKEGASQGYRDRWGIGWYKCNLELNEKKDRHKYFLCFEGIFENSTIWLGGKEIGGRKYGYSPFRLDVTKELVEGSNKILIKVDNTASPADRWYSGAGLYRAVELLEVDEKHFNEHELIVKTKLRDNHGVISIWPGVNEKVRATIDNENIELEGTGGFLELEIPNPRLWSAEEPNLYTLTLELLENQQVKDKITLRIGIREIEMRPNQGMYVNGQRVILKGVCLHQDIGARGIAAKKEMWQERLEILKEMGCNCIRPSHHIFPSYFLDLCDEMGFYVYEEAFDKWQSGLYARYFEENWQQDLDAMVKRDRNRPCIFIWGAGNEVENQGQDSMLNILKDICDYIRTLDDTRPITYAMNPHFKRESGIDASTVEDIQVFVDVADDHSITDIDEKVERIKKIVNLVDVISCNYQNQWYPYIHQQMPDKLILGTEVFPFFSGHPQQLKNFAIESPSLVPYQYDYVIGSIIWTGYDYLGESSVYPVKGHTGSLIRTNNEKRFSAHILESYWNEKPMVRFNVLDYSLADEGTNKHWDMPMYAEHWHFPQFSRVVVPYAIATNCDEVALYVNGVRHYPPKPMVFPNRVITGFIGYEPGTVEAVGLCGGVEVCRHTVTTPDIGVALRFDKNESAVICEEGYELLLTVRAIDSNGNLCFRESTLVSFTVDGPGEILAVDNGNLMNHEPYNNSFVHMYRGCASVLIRLKGDRGRVVVNAYAGGFRPGQTMIYVN